ncbi:hypothetical protein BpHYR1_049572 [Brachionus plicatilis]|uniref:Uncharacterized protein n=1 Tax=Brachionus plicatilis TaxID=10195 RepID=A0A3M7P4Q6_BRAPC|nr:hypothetical protein BpHYR1_049572 [Brachionus plicatilis]
MIKTNILDYTSKNINKFKLNSKSNQLFAPELARRAEFAKLLAIEIKLDDVDDIKLLLTEFVALLLLLWQKFEWLWL